MAHQSPAWLRSPSTSQRNTGTPASLAMLMRFGIVRTRALWLVSRTVMCLIPPAVQVTRSPDQAARRHRRWAGPRPRLACLPEAGDALPDADAHGRSRLAAASAPQFVQQCGGDPRARAAERVPDRDRAAVDVDQLGVALELVDDRHGLRRERLVDLDER